VRSLFRREVVMNRNDQEQQDQKRRIQQQEVQAMQRDRKPFLPSEPQSLAQPTEDKIDVKAGEA
jgi:hypothetical protein